MTAPTVGATDQPIDPDLAEIIRCWPDLPAATRAIILALVQGGSQRT